MERVRDLAEVREFFAARAAGWEDRFPDDGPKFAAAVAALDPPAGGVALDAACGTGRALPLLRRAVGEAGTVLGVDVTPDMLGEATRAGRREAGALVLGDVARLPLAARHSHEPDPDDIRAAPGIGVLLESTGWVVDLLDDGADRYLVVAHRK